VTAGPGAVLPADAAGRAVSAHVTRSRPAGPDHEVLSVEGVGEAYRRRPCGGEVSTPERPGCPWRVDAVGRFPAEAFAHSATTAYDLSDRVFACHESGAARPATCAGFLLRGADHNLAVRVRAARGRLDLAQVHDGGHELHHDYRAMAEANGVHPDDPRLAPCRDAR
jgi:hypothetical protein